MIRGRPQGIGLGFTNGIICAGVDGLVEMLSIIPISLIAPLDIAQLRACHHRIRDQDKVEAIIQAARRAPAKLGGPGRLGMNQRELGSVMPLPGLLDGVVQPRVVGGVVVNQVLVGDLIVRIEVEIAAGKGQGVHGERVQTISEFLRFLSALSLIGCFGSCFEVYRVDTKRRPRPGPALHFQDVFRDVPERCFDLGLPKIGDSRSPVEERVIGVATVVERRGRVLPGDGEVHHLNEELIAAGEIDHLLGDQDIGRDLVDHQPEVILARGARGSREVQQVPGDELYGLRRKREKKKDEDEK